MFCFICFVRFKQGVGQEGKSEHFVYLRQLKVFYTGMIQKYCLTFRNCNCDPVTSVFFALFSVLGMSR